MSKIIQKLESYAESLGLSCSRVANISGFMYDGNTIFYSDYGSRSPSIACDSNTACISNLAHEIAHYLVASPDRKHKIEYGLGMGPESQTFSGKLLTREQIKYEEAQASLLGMFIEIWAGHNPKAFTWSTHAWVEDSEFFSKLEELASLKFIQKVSEGSSLESYIFNPNQC